MTSSANNRRQFLRFLAGSPLLSRAWSQPAAPVISSPKEALSVMDFEPAARKALIPAHWGFLATGVDDDATLRANLEGFKHFQLRPRRLVDISQADLRTELFGTVWDTPIFLCPVGSQKTFHPEGEVAVARAAKNKKTLQILANVANSTLEDVTRALGSPPWYQLYMPTRWDETEKMVRAAEANGCTVLTWTIDMFAGRNTETMERFRRLDASDCNACHAAGPGATVYRPMFRGIQSGTNPPAATWDYVDRLKKLTKMKLVLKGLDTAEDARLCREHGVDGILVSNHGGRATETGRATIDALAEVVDAAGRQIPVLVDGGFRRGTDVYKALALGARAVGIGRPYIYGLSAFGQEGVERVLDILHAELRLVMRQCGTPSIAQITRASIVRVNQL
ncbi:MAG: alpha-hydroxy acid oxidase [Bryobacteraceae bacterium]|jgi:isopentenyl diphosphate isomerase/L-lactate dehydrogenase-like FMN-dependent dehydrogenase